MSREIDIRRDESGAIDEIVARGAVVHFEMMNDSTAILTVTVGKKSVAFVIFAKRNILVVGEQ